MTKNMSQNLDNNNRQECLVLKFIHDGVKELTNNLEVKMRCRATKRQRHQNKIRE